MKVVFVCQHFDEVLPPHQNSIGIWTYEVARRLAAGNEVTIIAPRPRREPLRCNIDGLNVQFLTCAPVRLWGAASRLWNYVWPHSPLFTRSYYAIDFLMQAVRRIRELAPDVVHLQNFPQYAPIIRRAAPNATIVLHMHCDWLVQLDLREMMEAVAACDTVVGCSSHVTDAARRRFSTCVGDKVRFAVLPNGAPVERLASVRTQRSPAKVLFVGRVSAEKGVHTLIEAWPKVVAAHPEARLDIVGPPSETPREFLVDLSEDPDVAGLSRFYDRANAYNGSYNAALRAMVPPHLGHTINFVNSEPYERILDRYAGASLLVNPSLSESFGMSLVEALATGTPVIATRVGGMPEIVEWTGGGLIVEKNEPDMLAAAINRLLADPGQAAAFGRRGGQRVAERYSWSRIAELTGSIYEQALSARQSRRPEAA